MQHAAATCPIYTPGYLSPPNTHHHRHHHHTCCAGPAALFVAPSLLPDFEGLDLLPPEAEAEAGAAYVVLGDMGPAMGYATLNRAFRQLMGQQQPELLSLGKSRWARRETLQGTVGNCRQRGPGQRLHTGALCSARALVLPGPGPGGASQADHPQALHGARARASSAHHLAGASAQCVTASTPSPPAPSLPM